MKLYKKIFSALCVLSAMSVNAIESADSLFTPYKLNYLPAGSPTVYISLSG